MPLGTLQHYTIEPSDLERTRNFYCDVLGLENGYRPPLDFPGYWLYSGGVAVHLMGTRKPREGIVVRGTEKIRRYRPARPHRVCRERCRRHAQALAVQQLKFRESTRAQRRYAVLFLRSRWAAWS
jgi:catechol 2,3-dioxygenase-like lactoylglutathione lyase family enzyme